MNALLLAASLIALEPNLEQDYNRTLNGSPLAMVMVIARYPDGKPFRGVIRCTGEWYKHADEPDHLTLPAMPFKTDGRGAVVLNPHLSDESITCWATDAAGVTGKTVVTFDAERPTGRFEIVLGQ